MLAALNSGSLRTFGDRMKLTVRVEDIMTPRRLLKHAVDDAEAQATADQKGFDAVPILGQDGSVREFWSRADRKRMRITRQHRIPHDSTVERLLPALGAHVVQFVYYRSEMVGLIDASDLNKPLGRMAWLHPMVELERAILDAVRDRKVDDKRQADALGNQAAHTQGRQAKAQRHDLEMPLLEYAQFQALLDAAIYLKIIQLSEQEIIELNEFRKRAAHGARPTVIDDRSDCARLTRALKVARAAAQSAARLSALRGR
jgi:hypothetical protein